MKKEDEVHRPPIRREEKGFRLPRWAVSFISGGVAGTVAKSSVAPLERVKILFQIRSKLYPYTGIVDTMRSIIRQEGYTALWKGNTATVVRIFPYAAVQFLSYEEYRKVLRKVMPGNTTLVNLIGGGAAGATCVLCTYPLDVVRVRLAVSAKTGEYNGILHCITSIIRHKGFTGLFSGIWPTLMGIIPYAAVNFATYEGLKTLVQPEGDLSVTQKLFCGGLAGAIGQTIAYPLDVVRRQMQTAGLKDVHDFAHRNTFSALKSILHNEGAIGLFRGLSINYVRVGPQVAISFTTYETVKKYLETKT
ncbi:mitochondrial substrate carrier family protein B-like [Planoprotostelium fungivorum]|uniref:Mitochondrial substrate carrier family protein B-like n=1 Tax=Planoprotostelium fungivorum TaxID=1890364 RepID=A0A2P6N751_9EUKA|nr:mitochondrial substrate carrier family protein B-like [Planoprotostelium fungivorum]